MKASVLDLRYNMKRVLKTLERNEKVTVCVRGKETAILSRIRKRRKTRDLPDHPAFGMWKDRVESPQAILKKLRKDREFGH